MIKREIFIGFFTGILTNLLGILLYILLFSDLSIGDSLREAARGDFLGTLVAAGAVLNFLPFFLFLRREKVYRARGVLMASLLAALVMAFLKLY